MKTKEQYLDDLHRGAERALLNDTEEDSWEQEQAAAEFCTSPLVRVTFPGSLLCAYGFSAGTMAQKKESQKVITALVDMCDEFSDILRDNKDSLPKEVNERVLEIKKNFINCKLDYIPFKGE